MAHLVPSIEKINSFAAPLTSGERTLMEALCVALDDSWTVYVQPDLNGSQPDIVIFSEEAGIGIFEVKDWNLESYNVENDGYVNSWTVYDGKQSRWINLKSDKCPYQQVQKYKNEIIKYELPIVGARSVLDEKIYALVAPFVYFHGHTTLYLNNKLQNIAQSHKSYISTFGYDSISSDMLQNILADRYLKAGSKFSNWMKENRLADRLRNALTPADYGNLNLESLLFAPNKKQAQLLKNNTGKKRVLGVAGSGKTIILARKAAIAGSEGKKVLLVCFNITMTNYLRDITKRLARQYESDTHHQIVVRHFHRLFPKEGIQQHEFENQFDVILVDEGQDFERNWIEQLYKLGRGSFHFMLAEDDRQNIYAKKREKKRVVPEIVGRPIKLNRSFRIPSSVAKLGNALMRWSGFNSEAGPVAVDLKNSQKSVFRPKWINGSSTELLKRIQMDVDHLIHDANTGALADIAILVCNVEDGWNICEILDTLSCSYSRSFETRAENKELSAKYEHDQKRLKLKVDELRRYQKMGFWMQQGHIKVCTIHSFKGWELNRILIYFRPEKNQKTVQTPLLYTAITRAQYDTKIYCADIELSQFGTIAGSQGLVDLENLSKSPVDS